MKNRKLPIVDPSSQGRKSNITKIKSYIDVIFTEFASIIANAFEEKSPLLVPTSMQSTSYYVKHPDQYHG